MCRALLAALEAAEGRRRARKRDQTPDVIGLSLKRELLQQALIDDPEPEGFEAWLLTYAEAHGGGACLATARAVFEEWQLAHSLGAFRTWLEQGARSDDAAGP